MDGDIIKINGERLKKKAFMLEESHPAIGRILIVNDIKYKIMDELTDSGTYIAPLTESDEYDMKEYDEMLDSLAEKLVNKVDLKRLIKENIKTQTPQEIKTGLFILEKEEQGETIEEEHHRGCYEFKIFYKNQRFSFWGGHQER